MGDVKRKSVEQQTEFIKTTGKSSSELNPADRAQLIRKGNESYNQGKFDLAERIFITCKYSDGLARIGDIHFKRQDYPKAMQLYVLSRDAGRIERLSKRMALVVRQWLLEDQAASQKPE